MANGAASFGPFVQLSLTVVMLASCGQDAAESAAPWPQVPEHAVVYRWPTAEDAQSGGSAELPPLSMRVGRVQRVGAGVQTLRGEGIQLIAPQADGMLGLSAPRAEWQAASGVYADGPIAFSGWLGNSALLGSAQHLTYDPDSHILLLNQPVWWIQGQRIAAAEMRLPLTDQEATQTTLRYPQGTSLQSQNASLLVGAALACAVPAAAMPTRTPIGQ